MAADVADDRLMERTATAARVAVAMGLMDVMGFVATRMSDARRIAITPGYEAAATLGRSRAEDLVLLDEHGTTIEGRWGPPAESALAAALLGAEPGASLIYGVPEATMALGAVGRVPQALTHTNSALVHGGMALVRPEGMVTDLDRARAVAVQRGAAATCQIVGMGVLVTGTSPIDAVRRIDSIELLARVTVAASGLGVSLPEMTEEQDAVIARSRPYEAQPSRDPARYYESLDPGWERSTLADAAPSAADSTDLARAMAQVAVASRLLNAEGLVTFFEHISQRVPGADDRFLKSPAHDYAVMRPEDIGILAMAGDCEPIACRFPPAPFRWLHRDMLVARSDVRAIVHTHPVHGRNYALAGRRPVMWHRAGVLAPQDVPVLGRPSLIFAEEDRLEALELLGSGPAIHGLYHGTDFVAGSIEEAAVMAIAHEAMCRTDHAVLSLGAPEVLPAGTVADLRERGPRAGQWWDFLTSRLAPMDEADRV